MNARSLGGAGCDQGTCKSMEVDRVCNWDESSSLLGHGDHLVLVQPRSRQSAVVNVFKTAQRGIVYSNHGCTHDYHPLEAHFLLKGASTAPPLTSFDHFHHFHMHLPFTLHINTQMPTSPQSISLLSFVCPLCCLLSSVLATSSCSSLHHPLPDSSPSATPVY